MRKIVQRMQTAQIDPNNFNNYPCKYCSFGHKKNHNDVNNNNDVNINDITINNNNDSNNNNNDVNSVTKLIEKIKREKNPKQRKQLIGNYLHAKIKEIKEIKEIEGTLTGKITGMLLESEYEELFKLMTDKVFLPNKVQEALNVLKQHQDKASRKNDQSDRDVDIQQPQQSQQNENEEKNDAE